jgi:NAD(P)-dependent dehydrogenase (short-subunit alcohol dehydrogenase family)
VTRRDQRLTPGEAVSEQDHKVVIVTGASRGIGAGVVAEYRRRGWAVVAASRTVTPAEDPAVITVEGDISDPATVDRIMSAAVESFGRIDTLINNAGIFISKPFTDYTADDYAGVVGVNLTGFFVLTQRVISEMLKRRSGHVVNITTTLADYANSSTPSVLTSLTKGGVASATKSLAIEYASRGIRVNAVSPGIIQTPEHSPEMYAALAGLHPLGRVGQVSDIVDGILFLESSPFITGEILHIDGGQIAGH